MTDRHTLSAANSSVTEEAASWLMRLQDQDCTRQDREQFEVWLGQDASHAREYSELLEVWTVSANLPRSGQAANAAVPRRMVRRRRSRLMALAASVSLVLLAGLLGWHQGWLPDSYRGYERSDSLRDVALPDGSKVQVNYGTSMSFLGFRNRRQIRLDGGEAFFSVQHDSSRPFQVLVGEGRVTVTGTQFNVWNYQDQVVVTLLEGSVKVESGVGLSSLTTAHLAPGQQARFSETLSLQVRSVDPRNALAWRQGKLIISDLSLAEALPLINRYLPRPVLLADDAAARIRIGGIYNTNDIEGLVHTLPKVAPVRIQQDAGGNTVIESAPVASM